MLKQSQIHLLSSLVKFIHSLSAKQELKTFSDFEKLWSTHHNKKRTAFIEIISDLSYMSSKIPSQNDSVAEPDLSILDTSIIPRSSSVPLHVMQSRRENSAATIEQQNPFLVPRSKAEGFKITKRMESLKKLTRLSELFSLPAVFAGMDRAPTLNDIEAYLIKTSHELRSSAILQLLKEVESSVFPISILKSLTLGKSYGIKELERGGEDLGTFARNLQSHCLSCTNWIEIAYWDSVCSGIQICSLEDRSLSQLVVCVEGQSAILRDLYCAKEYSDSSGEETICRVFINDDKLKKLSQNKSGKKVEVFNMLRRINQPFSRLDIGLASLLYFEVQILVTEVRKGEKRKVKRVKKLKNLKEIVNLWVMENQDNPEASQNKTLDIGRLRTYGDYLLHKMKNYETFNMMVEKEEFDDTEDKVPLAPFSPPTLIVAQKSDYEVPNIHREMIDRDLSEMDLT